MAMQENIDEFCKTHGYTDQSWYGKLAFVERQWGMFFTWLREKHPRLITIEVKGGVASVRGQVPPDVEVEIVDLD